MQGIWKFPKAVTIIYVLVLHDTQGGPMLYIPVLPEL